ncbi:MAG: hypothetical protein C4325_10590 [Blastocatellia bacterium]
MFKRTKRRPRQKSEFISSLKIKTFAGYAATGEFVKPLKSRYRCGNAQESAPLPREAFCLEIVAVQFHCSFNSMFFDDGFRRR